MDGYKIDYDRFNDDDDDYQDDGDDDLYLQGYDRARSGSYTFGQEFGTRPPSSVRYGMGGGGMYTRMPQYRRYSNFNISDPMALHFLQGVPIESSPSSVDTTSSNSGEESTSVGVGPLEDPYKVTLHYVTNPRQSLRLYKLMEPLIKCFDPSFKLFNIAERSRSNGLQVDNFDRLSHKEYPALAVVLFLLQDDDADDFNEDVEEHKLSQAQGYLCKRPWKKHHSSCLPGNFATCRRNDQHFYTTERDIPLWAVRQVHHGKEHLRFMIYSTHAHWEDMVEFYSLLVGRKADYERDDFCYFLIHNKDDMDIQLALKKVPFNCKPRALSSAFLQIKVREIGELVPLLPNACSPISPQRWQTNDPDGNVTLLLVNRKQLNTSNTIQGKSRQQSTDVLQTLFVSKALKPMARLSPRLYLAPVSDDENGQ